MRVPQVDLTAQFQTLRSTLMPAIEQVLESGQLFLGPNTQAFEAEFAAYCGTRFCVGVGNGTDALQLALRAAGVGNGDEVITVSHTFIAAVEAIVQVGARPVFVDVDPATMLMAVEQLESRISERTRAIVPVHLYGQLVDMTPVMDVARRHGLVVVEDASQAHGAVAANGQRAGGLGHIATFSFYYAKNLGAYGEAGAITTSDAELDRRVRLLRSHGEAVRYEHAVLGFNSRIDEIQAAVLRIKLRHLDDWNARRRAHAIRYDELLADTAVQRPHLVTNGSHVYHQYVVRTTARDELRQALAEQEIGTGVHYPIPVHLQPACRDLGYRAGDLPNTERAAREVLSLPMYAELTDAQLACVARAISELAGVQRPTGVSTGT
jgi:dTDP-4-amino-4,6-dideoxygalactose transaminase